MVITSATVEAPVKKASPRQGTRSKRIQHQQRSKGRKNTDDESAPRSPSQVQVWYAAKNTTRPGTYVYKEVAESYNLDKKGIIKQFTSLAAARQWLQMPTARTCYEKECYKSSSTKSKPSAFFAKEAEMLEFISP